MRVWIDLANSPHPPLFFPIAQALEARGHEIAVTVWDRANTLSLARSFWSQFHIIGEGNRKSVIDKGRAVGSRALALRDYARATRPSIALSHNSYAQIVGARLAGVRVITMMDYEHQPANHLAFRLAHAVLVPETFPLRSAIRTGARKKLHRYAGFKEEIALTGFAYDPMFRQRLGVDDKNVLAVCRPPPEGALYHRHRNDLFDEAITHVAAQGATVLISPRNRAQADRFARSSAVRVLETPVQGASLLSVSDLVIGAGGTMTREAAILGIPAYTLFSGRAAAVDEALIKAGRLTPIRSPADFAAIRLARAVGGVEAPNSATTTIVVDLIEEASS